MTKIIFADGRVLLSEVVVSRSMMYNGTNREAYIFTFPEDTSVDSLLSHFTPDNCDQIWLEDEEGNRFLHEHFTIRISAGVSDRGQLLNVGEDTDHRMIAFVKMCKETTMETRVRQLQETTDIMLTNMLEEG